MYNTSHNHRKYCNDNKKQLFQISKLMTTLGYVRGWVGVVANWTMGTVQARYRFFFRLVRGWARDWVKVPPSQQFHGAAIKIEPTQSQMYSWTSTNGHLSTTANSLQEPFSSVSKVAVVERFNCKFKISGQWYWDKITKWRTNQSLHGICHLSVLRKSLVSRNSEVDFFLSEIFSLCWKLIFMPGQWKT